MLGWRRTPNSHSNYHGKCWRQLGRAFLEAMGQPFRFACIETYWIKHTDSLAQWLGGCIKCHYPQKLYKSYSSLSARDHFICFPGMVFINSSHCITTISLLRAVSHILSSRDHGMHAICETTHAWSDGHLRHLMDGIPYERVRQCTVYFCNRLHNWTILFSHDNSS